MDQHGPGDECVMVVMKTCVYHDCEMCTQEPNIKELQKVLYRQLTSFAMPVENDSNLEEQLDIMKTAAAQKRWLLILDGDL